MFVDTHTHSTFSTDSVMSVSDAVTAALHAGLSGIAFSDHFDFEYTDAPDEFHFDFHDYFKTMSEWRQKLSGKLDIYYAVEVGYQPISRIANEIKKQLDGFEFDLIIGSTHLINRKDPYNGSFYTGQLKYDAYREYIEEVLKNLRIYDNFDALGHIDYHTRYANYPDNRFYYREFPDELDAIFRFIIEKGIAFEINTKTYVKTPIDTRLLTRYKELGGELITLGSDAHNAQSVGLAFRQFADLIKDCGFDYITHFKNRKPVLTKI